MPTKNVFGQKVYVQVPVDIDEESLKAIATKTGGKYYPRRQQRNRCGRSMTRSISSKNQSSR